jgi:formylglycine-generating enzyme required for sulfatase activity
VADSPILADGRDTAKLAPGAVFRDCTDCPEMVVVPAGRFTMGSPKEVRERLRAEDEGPDHEVSFAAPFAIGRYHVTYVDWEVCERDQACPSIYTRSDPRRGRRPAMAMSWPEAKGFADWLSKRTKQAYRLPTEAEWEYAARGGTTTAYYTGEAITHAQANFGEFNGGTDPVGTYPPNAFGLYDMAGNAWHWVEDVYRRSYAPDPQAYADARSHRVVRGGSWASQASDLRSAKRVDISPDAHPDNTGFRLVREIQ